MDHSCLEYKRHKLENLGDICLNYLPITQDASGKQGPHN